MIEKGSYCLATKYDDGDPGDAWAVGYYLGELPKVTGSRHLVGGADGKSYRANGYRRARAGLRPDVGEWLLRVAKELEWSPPGAVNLWEMLGDRAFETDEKEGPIMMTTEEAKTKQCPSASNTCGSWTNSNGVDRKFCSAGECMAWRWVDALHTAEMGGLKSFHTAPSNTEGYCGLAGKP